MNTYKQNRSGYTLIELLVVIGLVATLAALTAAFYPSAAASATESRAAMQVQGWLNIAKQKALRDQAPRGLRLWLLQSPAWNNLQSYAIDDTVTFGGAVFRCIQPNSNNTPVLPISPYWILWLVVTDCQYIEQPEDFAGGPTAFGNPPNQIQSGVPPLVAPGYTVQNTLGFLAVDPTNGYGVASLPDPNSIYWSVQPNDYLELSGTGLVRRIFQVGVPKTDGTIDSRFIVVNPPLANPIGTPTTNYRIVRSPRPVGDETLKLPTGTVIDLMTNLTFLSPLPFDPNSINGGYIDILFAPSGEVISRGVSAPNLNLWVRTPAPFDPNNVTAVTDPYRGDPNIVSVFVRTGLVNAFKPARPGPANPTNNPYLLVY
jgi:prepilin-type N-terminal cleavage/methylation domain-containing protein